MNNRDYMELTYDRVVTETASALLLAFNQSHIWIPKSLVHDSGSLDINGGTVLVMRWAVKDRGLEAYET